MLQRGKHHFKIGDRNAKQAQHKGYHTADTHIDANCS